MNSKMTNSTLKRFSGKGVHSGIASFGIIESAVCEGIGSLCELPIFDRKNIYGRDVILNRGKDAISFISGLSISGLRTSVLTDASDIMRSVMQLQSLVRNHQPTLITAAIPGKQIGKITGYNMIKTISGITGLVMCPEDISQALDYYIIGHKIAETALVPVVCIIDDYSILNGLQNVKIPDPKALSEFIGDSEDFIDSPTATQEMVFGKRRRRIPNWFSVDYPILTASEKSTVESSLELVSDKTFFTSHIHEISEDVFSEFANTFGRKHNFTNLYKTDDASYIIIALGEAGVKARHAVDILREQKHKVGCAVLSVITSQCILQLGSVLKGRKAIAVVEPVAAEASFSPFYSEISALLADSKQSGNLQSYQYVKGSFSTQEAIDIFNNLFDGKNNQRHYYTGILSNPSVEDQPKLEIFFQNIQRNYPGLERKFLQRKESISKSTNKTLQWEFMLCDGFLINNLAEILNSIIKTMDIQISGKGGYRINNKYCCAVSITQNTDSVASSDNIGNDVLFYGFEEEVVHPDLINHVKQNGTVILLGSDVDKIKIDQELESAIKNNNLQVRYLSIDNSEISKLKITGVCTGLLRRYFDEDKDLKKHLNQIEKSIETTVDKSQVLSLLEEGINDLDVALEISATDLRSTKVSDVPLLLRSFSDKGPEYCRLSRFNDHLGQIQPGSISNQNTIDPFKAVPALPPLTSALINVRNKKGKIPLVNNVACTACGKCSLYCPHFALPPLVTSIEKLLNTAIGMAADDGIHVSQLTPTIKNLSKFAGLILNKINTPVSKIGDFLPDAFEEMAKQMKVEGVKLDALKKEFQDVMGYVAELQVTKSDIFYNEPERSSKGSGSFFVLSVNLASCTGCGICAEVCQDDAIEMATLNKNLSTQTQKNFSIWEQLPDTDGDIINKAFNDESYDSLAAIMLSKHFYSSMFGGDIHDNSAPSKVLLHILTAYTESVQQPVMLKMISVIDEQLEAMRTQLREFMADALPLGKINELADVLSSTNSQKLTLEEILKDLKDKGQLKQINTEQLNRKLQLINDLKTLRWILAEGPSGNGRSRYSIALLNTDHLNWLGEYPGNHFTVPVHMPSSGDRTSWLSGLVEGYIRNILDNIRLLRRANLEVKDKYKPEQHDNEIANLSWDDLNEEEVSMVPPLLVIGTNSGSDNLFIGKVASVLKDNYPLKIIMLCPSGFEQPKDLVLSSTLQILNALALQKLFVLQSNLAQPSYLADGLVEAIKTPAPALLQIYIPEYSDYANWLKTCRLALESRLFPSLKYNPLKPGDTLASRIDLSGNPEPDNNLTMMLKYVEGEEEKELTYEVSAADVAFANPALSKDFVLCDSEHEETCFVSEYMRMSQDERRNKQAVIAIIDKEKKLQKYKVPDKIIAKVQTVMHAWSVIKDLAGMTSAFPEKIRAKIEAEIKDAHQKEIEEMESEFNKKLNNLESEHLEQMRIKIKEKLLALSGGLNS